MPINFNYNDNVMIILGTSAKDNHDIIKSANPNDWWLHMDSVPSGHIIIKSKSLKNMDDITNSYNILNFASEKCFNGLQLNKRNKFIRNNSAFFYVTISQVKNIILTENVGEVEFISESKNKLRNVPIKLNLTF